MMKLNTNSVNLEVHMVAIFKFYLSQFNKKPNEGLSILWPVVSQLLPSPLTVLITSVGIPLQTSQYDNLSQPLIFY